MRWGGGFVKAWIKLDDVVPEIFLRGLRLCGSMGQTALGTETSVRPDPQRAEGRLSSGRGSAKRRLPLTNTEQLIGWESRGPFFLMIFFFFLLRFSPHFMRTVLPQRGVQQINAHTVARDAALHFLL